MRDKTALENLNAKISLVLERYSYLKRENIRLREENSKLLSELSSVKELLMEKREEIVSLKEKEFVVKREIKTPIKKKVDKKEVSRYNVYSFLYKKILQKSMGTTWFRLD